MNSNESMLRRRVMKELETYIYSHEPGEKLPAEPVLAKQLGVSRTTIRAVLEYLAASGVVQKRHGSGTYISPKPFLAQESLLRYVRYPVLIEMKGYTATERDRKIFTTQAEPYVSQLLHLEENETCVVIQKVYFVDDQPAVLCRDTIPLTLIPAERRDAFLAALYRRDMRELIFEETGRRTVQNVVDLHAILSTDVPGFAKYREEDDVRPMILMRGCYFDHNRQALFFNEAYLDTDYLDLHLNR